MELQLCTHSNRLLAFGRRTWANISQVVGTVFVWFQISWLIINLKENDTFVSSKRKSKRAEKWVNGVVSSRGSVGSSE